MSAYVEKLRHPLWQRKRLEILQRDKFTCQSCKTEEVELHVHHIEYSRGEPWEIDPESLITLCKDCHKITESHGGGEPPLFVSWCKNRLRAIAFTENYLFVMEPPYEESTLMLNWLRLKHITDCMPEGWLEYAEKFQLDLAKRMAARQKSDPVEAAINKLNRSSVDINTALDLHDIAESGNNLSNAQKTRLHSAVNQKIDRG